MHRFDVNHLSSSTIGWNTELVKLSVILVKLIYIFRLEIIVCLPHSFLKVLIDEVLINWVHVYIRGSSTWLILAPPFGAIVHKVFVELWVTMVTKGLLRRNCIILIEFYRILNCRIILSLVILISILASLTAHPEVMFSRRKKVFINNLPLLIPILFHLYLIILCLILFILIII